MVPRSPRNRSCSRAVWLAMAVGVFGVAWTVAAQAQPDAAQRRVALLATRAADAERTAELVRGLSDADPVVARTAARLLTGQGKGILKALPGALRHRDMLVRRIIVSGLGSAGPPAVDALARALDDGSPLVRQAAVLSLSSVRPRSKRTSALIKRAARDESALVAEAAILASRAFYDVIAEIPLPRDGWKLKLDPPNAGEAAEWFAPQFDDSDWQTVEIERPWQDFGHDYQGYGWYRRTIELPKRETPERVELAFGGVDENAWVWINGRRAGDHAIGPEGWDKPFRIDITDLVRWGEANQFTVRAMNTVGHGGIWRPVKISLLKTTD